MEMSKDDKNLIEEAIARIPSTEEILSESVKRIPSEKLSPEYLRTHFNEVLINLEHSAYEIYKENENKAFLYMIELWIKRNEDLILRLAKNLNELAFAKEICGLSCPLARTLEFRVGQMRKSRGGKTFEFIVELLLKKMNIRCERPKSEGRKILKRTDLVVPDQQTALTRPDQAFFISCKRTLRERWKQTIPERKPSWRVFLLTIDDNLPEEKANEIDQLGIIAYVPDDLKNRPYLINKGWIRRLSDLPGT